MKTVSRLIMLTLVFCSINVSPWATAASAVQSEDDPLVTARLSDADVETMLGAYSVWTGKKIDVPAEVKRLRTSITLKFDKIKRSEAIMRAALALREAGVEIVRREDGGLVARLVADRGK